MSRGPNVQEMLARVEKVQQDMEAAQRALLRPLPDHLGPVHLGVVYLAAAQDAQNKASSAARRTELIRFADEFEAAVGAIVSNVSASAVQLESAAGTLTRTAETTQTLSSQVAGSSEEASSSERLSRE